MSQNIYVGQTPKRCSIKKCIPKVQRSWKNVKNRFNLFNKIWAGVSQTIEQPP